ncbi:MAG: dephospho-CoA kinase [Nitrospirota bacterium]
MLLIGLTGNYGSGKSTVLAMFEKLGAITLNADRIVGSLLKDGDVLEEIRDILGDGVFNKDGSLNKKMVADLIFKSDILRRSLEDILHPLVFSRIKDFLDKIGEKERIAVIEAPVIYERGYKGRFDKTIVVHTKEDIALNRLEKDGIMREEALLRMKTQMPIEDKKEKADFLIDNNGDTEKTMTQVEIIYNKLLKEAGYGDSQRS